MKLDQIFIRHDAQQTLDVSQQEQALINLGMPQNGNVLWMPMERSGYLTERYGMVIGAAGEWTPLSMTNNCLWVESGNTGDPAGMIALRGLEGWAQFCGSDAGLSVKWLSDNPVNNRAGYSFDMDGPYLTGFGNSYLSAGRKYQCPDRNGTLALLQGPQTFTGEQSFSGQVELTGQAASNATSAVNRAMAAVEMVMNTYNIWSPFGNHRGSAAGGTGGPIGSGGYANAATCRCGTGQAGAWARTIISYETTNSVTQTANQNLCSVPLAVSLAGSFDPGDASSNGCVLRINVGDTNVTTTAPPLGNSAPLSARGFGVEFYWSVTNARKEVRLFAHNGTTLVYGSGIPWNGSWNGVQHVIVASNGAGRIQLYLGVSSAGILGRPVLQTAATIPAGGPTSGIYGNTGTISVTAVAGGSVAPTADSLFQYKTGLIALNTTL